MLKNAFVKKFNNIDFINKTKQFVTNARNYISKKSFIRKNSHYNKFDIYSLLPFVIGMYLYTKKLSCYSVSNKELDKVMNFLDKEIKNLEFKHQGKIKRQPIRSIFINSVMEFVILDYMLNFQ
jgi:hypothetical protein